jgi:hypothetical protein
MKMSISIMMHPSRAEYLPYLKSKLGDVPVALDDGVGLLQNCKNAWNMRDLTADYHCVIQDDCIICENFKERAVAYLEKANGLPVSFFYSQSKFYEKYKNEREETGAIIKKDLFGGLAICLPMKIIPAMLEYYDKQTIPFDDHRIGKFCMENHFDFYNPFPNLIDHRQNIMSIFNKQKSQGKAAEFIGEN